MCNRSFLALAIVICLRTPFSRADDPAAVLAQFRRVLRNDNARLPVTIERREAAWQVTGLPRWGLTLDRDVEKLKALAVVETVILRDANRVTPEAIGKLAALPRLRKLEVDGPLTEAQIEAVCALPNVEGLDLQWYAPQGQVHKVCPHLRNLRNLRRLNLNDAGLSDESLDFIAPLTGLEELDLTGSPRITDAGMAKLKSLRNLRSLRIQELGPMGLAALKDLPRLEHLDIFGPERPPAKVDLRLLRSLKSLCVGYIYPGQAPVSLPRNLRRLHVDANTLPRLDLKSAGHIERLEIDSTRAPAERFPNKEIIDWESLTSLPELRDLVVRGANHGDVEAIGAFRSLRTLAFHSMEYPGPFSDDDMKALAGLADIESLSIYASRMTDAGMQVLRNFHNLKQLRLGGFDKVTTDGLGPVWELKRLKVLELDFYFRAPPYGYEDERAVDRVLHRVNELPDLEDLSVGRTVTDEGLKNLASLKKLRRLDLTDVRGFSDGALASLMRTLPELQVVKFTLSHEPRPGQRAK